MHFFFRLTHASLNTNVTVQPGALNSVEIANVLGYLAYDVCLLVCRVCARPSSLKAIDSLKKEENQIMNLAHEVDPCQEQPVELLYT